MFPKKPKLASQILGLLFVLACSLSSVLAQAPAPVLNKPHRSTDGQVQLSVNGFTNFFYTLETSSDLTNWIPVQTNSTLKDTGIATFQLTSSIDQKFFRAKGWGRRYYSLFQGSLVAKEYIDLNGNNLSSDSYDSSNPYYSSYVTNVNFGTNLVYDVTKRLDHGDVAATLGITNVASLGNVNIWGRLHTGLGPIATTADIGLDGKVGEAIWQANGSGFQPGAWLYDMNVEMPAVSPPPSGGLPLQGATLINGVVYDKVMTSGKDQSTTPVSGKVYVAGSNIVLWAKVGLNFSGNTSGIFLAPGASVIIYVGTSSSTNFVTADLTGRGGINANGYAKNCQIYGLPNCTSIKMSGNAAFVGTIYAPNAALAGTGGGSDRMDPLDSMGAIIVKRVTLNGHWHFHFDEALNWDGPIYSDPNVLSNPLSPL